MLCTLWYHYSKDTSVFPGVALPLKVLILGVPNLNLAARILWRQPTFSSVQGALQATVVAHWVPIPSPLEGNLLVLHIRVPSSNKGPPVTQGCGPLGDTFNSLCATSCQRSPISCHYWASPRSMWNWHRALPSGWGSLGGDQETSSPSGVGDWVPEEHVFLPSM